MSGGAVETFMSKFARRDTRPSVVQNRADVFLQRPNMSELRLPYYSTPSLCWYPKWLKFPHCIANSRPPPSSPDLAENITSKVLFNTRQDTTVRKSSTYSQNSQWNTHILMFQIWKMTAGKRDDMKTWRKGNDVKSTSSDFASSQSNNCSLVSCRPMAKTRK